MYRGSPTSTVSSSTISTSTVFQCYVLKTVLVEFLCTKNRTSGNWLCSTHQYEFRIVRFFPNPKNRTKRGPPVQINPSSLKSKTKVEQIRNKVFCVNSCSRTKAESFYNINYGLSIITLKVLQKKSLSHQNKLCFCFLQDKTRIKMPK